MTERTEVNWFGIIVEGTAIVVSILFAFWIDAWWDESQDRERELVVLQALLDDLEGMRRQVDTQRLFNEGILDATTTLLAAGTAGSSELSAEDVDRLLADVVWYNAPATWESATMDLLVSAGDLAGLSDIELVQQLGSLHYRLKRTQDRYRLDESFYRERLIPFLGENANLPQILSGIEHGPGVPDWTYSFVDIEIANKRDHTALLSNTRFQGLLAARIDVQHDILNYSLANLGDDLDAVIAMLQSNLGRRR